MSRTTGMLLSAFAVAALAALPAVATDELAVKEEKKCTACHAKKGSPLLNDKGKYYEYKRTFDGYDQLLRKFKKCTVCHVQEPGNPELTRSGLELKTREVTMDHLSAPDPKREPRKKK